METEEAHAEGDDNEAEGKFSIQDNTKIINVKVNGKSEFILEMKTSSRILLLVQRSLFGLERFA